MSAYARLGEIAILAIMEFPGVGEAMKANKARGISFATIPALPIEDFDKLLGGKP